MPDEHVPEDDWGPDRRVDEDRGRPVVAALVVMLGPVAFVAICVLTVWALSDFV